MKNKLIYLATVAFVALTFIACEKEDDSLRVVGKTIEKITVVRNAGAGRSGVYTFGYQDGKLFWVNHVLEDVLGYEINMKYYFEYIGDNIKYVRLESRYKIYNDYMEQKEFYVLHYSPNGEVIKIDHISDNSNSYTVNNSTDIEWSDGHPVVIGDEKLSWNDGDIIMKNKVNSESRQRYVYDTNPSPFGVSFPSLSQRLILYNFLGFNPSAHNVTNIVSGGSYESSTSSSYDYRYSDDGYPTMMNEMHGEAYTFYTYRDGDGSQLPTLHKIDATGYYGVGGSGYYIEGEQVVLTAYLTGRADFYTQGYEFVCWTENDKTVSTNNPYIFICTGNRKLTAVFQ